MDVRLGPPKPDWVLAASPLGKVPVLQTDNAVVFESQVIAEYIDETTPGSLHPVDPLEKARHRSWIEYGSATLNSIGSFYNARNENAFEENRLAAIHSCGIARHTDGTITVAVVQTFYAVFV